jgi:hypothetical protein
MLDWSEPVSEVPLHGEVGVEDSLASPRILRQAKIAGAPLLGEPLGAPDLAIGHLEGHVTRHRTPASAGAATVGAVDRQPIGMPLRSVRKFLLLPSFNSADLQRERDTVRRVFNGTMAAAEDPLAVASLRASNCSLSTSTA